MARITPSPNPKRRVIVPGMKDVIETARDLESRGFTKKQAELIAAAISVPAEPLDVESDVRPPGENPTGEVHRIRQEMRARREADEEIRLRPGGQLGTAAAIVAGLGILVAVAAVLL